MLRNGIIGGVMLWGLIALGCSAMAQTTATGTGQAAAGADASAGAASQSGAAITQNYYNAGNAGLTYGGGTNNLNRQIIEGGTSDRYRATIRNTPDAYAPNVSGGTNSCLVGMSGAGSVAGFGFGLGGNWSDPDCERRQLAALAHNTGQPQLAQEVMCGSTAVREARIRLGQPCLADVPRPAQVAAQPVVLTSAPAAPVASAVVTAPSRPDWCYTATAAERRRYPGVCG